MATKACVVAPTRSVNAKQDVRSARSRATNTDLGVTHAKQRRRVRTKFGQTLLQNYKVTNMLQKQ